MGFIRGSQLVDHTLRMGGQSLKNWITWICITWLTVLCVMIYVRVDDIHISHLKSWSYGATSYWNDKRRIPIVNREATTLKRKLYKGYMEQIEKKKPERAGLRQIIVYYQSPRNTVKTPEIHKSWWDVVDIATVSFWQSAVIAVILSLGYIILISKMGKKTKGNKFIRGRELVSKKQLIKLINKENKKEKIKDPYKIAGIPYHPHTEMEHLMIVAATGSGKTVLNKELISQIKARGDKAIIYDYTGSFTESFYDPDKDVIINPFDKRSKPWCLLREAAMEAEFDTIAAALIASRKEGNDPFWPNGARLIFAELCKKQFREKNYSTQTLYKYLNRPLKQLNKILKDSMARNFTDPESKKTTLGLLMLLSTYLKGLQYIEDSEDNYFSIKKWMLDREDKSTVFLTSRPTMHDSIQPLISAMMDIAINNLGELPVGTKEKTWLIFDEVASLNYLPSLEKGLTISRNYGGCFVISLQSISQLSEIYGTNKTETMTSNCKSKVIMNLSSESTARWASRLIGAQEIEQHKEGLSYGAHEMRDGVNLSKHTSEQFLVMPTEILSLPKFKGYALMSGGYPVAPIEFEELKYKKYKFSNPGFIEKEVKEKIKKQVVEKKEEG